MLSYTWYDFQPYYSSNHMKYTIEKRTGRPICETLIGMTRKLKERSEKKEQTSRKQNSTYVCIHFKKKIKELIMSFN